MIETKVDGSPAAVRAAAHFLRDTLAKAATTAGDQAATARRVAAGSWEGAASEAYRDRAGALVEAADEQSEHAAAAGQGFEDYAGRLERFQDRMAERRSMAQGGGLVVTGTVIEQPKDAVPPADLPAGSTPEQAHRWELAVDLYKAQCGKVELYNEIHDDVVDDWATFRAWIDAELGGFWDTVEQPTIAEQAANFLSNASAAAVAFSLDLHQRYLARYAEEAAHRSAELTEKAAAAKVALRSGNPARRAAGAAVDTAESRLASQGLAEARETAGRFAKGIPVVGYAIGLGSSAYAISHGESPGRVITGEASSIAGGAMVAGSLVAGAAAFNIGVPVLVTAGVALGAGYLASWGAEAAWDHWVPDGTKEAIDEGLEDFGQGVKDMAGDVGDAVTHWN